MNRSFSLTLALLMFVLAGTAGAAGTSTVSDVAGDYLEQPMCGGQMCEPFQDILHASLSEDGFTLHLTLEVAAGIPAAPWLKNSVKEIAWGWRLDLDPATSPSGGTLPPGISSPFELNISVLWDGQSFRGVATDRRPLLTGGTPLVTEVPAVVNGTAVSLDLPLASLNLPLVFRWRAATNVFNSDVPSMGQYPVDTTPFVVMQRSY